ncbi:MAG TPA: divalent-cation tolerance protein CutA [Candidatus Binataceae bacterium]|nr:divalent-cation tolerance protein CutA [Candidatus Binataceae bacterium]
MPPRTPHRLIAVLTTTATEQQAAAIARTLVDERLAACVNIVGPIRSVYRWRAAVEDEREFLLVIKTRATLYVKAESRIRQLHSYEVPEVICLPIGRGAPPYVKWLLESTAGGRVAK